jgi:hypothetical protein
MSTLLTSADYDTLALAEQLRLDWIRQTTLRCFDDSGYVCTAIDPLKNPPPTLEDAVAIQTSSRTLH